MRHHKFKIDFMNNILNKNNDEKKQTVLTGDSNLKLIKFSKSRDVNQFLEKMFCQNLISQKTLPTRVSAEAATLTRNCFSRNITTPTSDYLPQFLIVKSFRSKTCIYQKDKRHIRDYPKKFNKDLFQIDFEEILEF